MNLAVRKGTVEAGHHDSVVYIVYFPELLLGFLLIYFSIVAEGHPVGRVDEMVSQIFRHQLAFRYSPRETK